MLPPYPVYPVASVVERTITRRYHAVAAMSLASSDMEELRGEQLRDPHIEPILRAKETTIKPTADEIKAMGLPSHRLFQLWEQLTITNGLLSHQFETPDGSRVFPQLVVPASRREKILKDMHEGVIGGHLGEEKTLARVKERYYWRGTTMT